MSFSFLTSRLLVLVCSGIFFYMPFFAFGAALSDVVINEVAWMGTKASSADEWVELKNTTGGDIDLAGWGLYEGTAGDVRIIVLTKKIAASGYYLIERSDDNAVADVAADDAGPFSGNGLNNGGERLVLKDGAGNVIDALDFVSGWPAGAASPSYQTMERDAAGWRTNDGTARNGADAKGNPIEGTPGAHNSGVNTITVPATESAPPVALPAPSPAPLPQTPIEQISAPVSGITAESMPEANVQQQAAIATEPPVALQSETAPSEIEALNAPEKKQVVNEVLSYAKDIAKNEDIGENNASAVRPLVQEENTKKDIVQPALASRAFEQGIYALIAGAFGLVVWLSLRRRPAPVVEEAEREE